MERENKDKTIRDMSTLLIDRDESDTVLLLDFNKSEPVFVGGLPIPELKVDIFGKGDVVGVKFADVNKPGYRKVHINRVEVDPESGEKTIIGVPAFPSSGDFSFTGEIKFSPKKILCAYTVGNHRGYMRADELGFIIREDMPLVSSGGVNLAGNERFKIGEYVGLKHSYKSIGELSQSTVDMRIVDVKDDLYIGHIDSSKTMHLDFPSTYIAFEREYIYYYYSDK